MRVLVLWAGPDSTNLGVRVLAHGTASLLEGVLPEGSTIEFQDFEAGNSETAFNKNSVVANATRIRSPILERLQGFDLIVDTGAGDSFTDIYGMKRHILMSYVRGQAQKAGIPIVFGPQTIGPFNKVAGRALARPAMRRALAIFARDSVSLAFGQSLVGDRVVASTDVVFALPQPRRSAGHDVVLNVSGLLWGGAKLVSADSYRATVRQLVTQLRSSGREVVVMPHVLDSANADNDVPACREVADQFELEMVVPSSLTDVRELLASSQVVLGSRMHACLNALSVGTPAVPLAYSRKFAPLMSDLGWSYTIDLNGTGSAVETAMSHVATLSDPAAVGSQLTALRSLADAALMTTRVALASAVFR